MTELQTRSSFQSETCYVFHSSQTCFIVFRGSLKSSLPLCLMSLQTADVKKRVICRLQRPDTLSGSWQTWPLVTPTQGEDFIIISRRRARRTEDSGMVKLSFLQHVGLRLLSVSMATLQRALSSVILSLAVRIFFIRQLSKPPLFHSASASSDYMNILFWFLLKLKTKIQARDQSLEHNKTQHRINRLAHKPLTKNKICENSFV